MILLIDKDELKKHKSGTKSVPCKCEQCDQTFLADKRQVNWSLKNPDKKAVSVCSLSCATHRKLNFKPAQNIECKRCGKSFSRTPLEIKRSISGFSFCSQSCSTTYNNQNKKTGTRRSKFEKHIEDVLTTKYPMLELHFNRKDTIQSELDLYIPSCKLAFEFNGIFHYLPIFGDDKFNKIVANDTIKVQKCLAKNIELIVVDMSKMKQFNPVSCQEYVENVSNIINDALVLPPRIERGPSEPKSDVLPSYTTGECLK